MKHRSRILPICLVPLFGLAIWRSDLVVSGAKDGISLCLQVIIPAIFPFLFLSMLLCSCWTGMDVAILRPLCRITGIPSSEQSILLFALIGGYPVGAQVVTQSYRNGRITLHQAKRLLAFCNNAGPSFIFGLIGTIFESALAPVLLWLIHIGSALAVGILLPNKRTIAHSAVTGKKENVSQILLRSVKTTGAICGWVVLFRIVIAMIDERIIVQNPVIRAVVIGCTELSNGCVMLSNITSEPDRFVVASGLLAAGGLCVALQTVSVTDSIGLGCYLPGKLLQICISLVAATIAGTVIYHEQMSYLTIIPSIAVIIFTLAVIKRKNSSIFFENDI